MIINNTPRIEKAATALPTINKLFALLHQNGFDPGIDHLAGVLRWGGIYYVTACREERKKHQPGISIVPQYYEQLTGIHIELKEALLTAELEVSDITVKDGSAALTDEFIMREIN